MKIEFTEIKVEEFCSVDLSSYINLVHGYRKVGKSTLGLWWHMNHDIVVPMKVEIEYYEDYV